MKLHALIAATLFTFAAVTAPAAEVSWSAADDNGLADLAGVPLLPTDLLLLGSFNISDEMIKANSGNIGYLMSHFAQFGSSSIGTNVGGTPGEFFQDTINNSSTTTPFPVAGQRIYIWAFNTPIAATATQIGIFSQSVAGNWVFPAQGGIPDTTSVDLTDLTDVAGTSLVAGADIVIGDFGQGLGNTQDFNLALVPEPSTYVLAVVGGLGLLALRRRRSSAPR